VLAQGQPRYDWHVTEGTSVQAATSNAGLDFQKLRLEPNISSFVSSVNSYLLLLSPPGREAMVFLTSTDRSRRSSPDSAGEHGRCPCKAVCQHFKVNLTTQLLS